MYQAKSLAPTTEDFIGVFMYKKIIITKLIVVLRAFPPPPPFSFWFSHMNNWLIHQSITLISYYHLANFVWGYRRICFVPHGPHPHGWRKRHNLCEKTKKYEFILLHIELTCLEICWEKS